MSIKTPMNPPARSEEPQGDLGQGHKTWTPDSGEQGISNRPDDEGNAVPDGDPEDDDVAFNGDDDDDDDVDDDDVEEEGQETENP